MTQQTESNDGAQASAPLTQETAVVYQPIGVVRSRFVQTTGMPIQTAGAQDEPGQLEVFQAFRAGLRDIQEFEYLIVLTHLHQAAQRLEVVPFLDDRSHGIFATRSPARPNRIGLSIVRLLSVENGLLHFAGNDMLDGTPVLDIKPYVPRFDVRETQRIGWFAQRIDTLAQVRADDRMG